jgi:hypothetical protein
MLEKLEVDEKDILDIKIAQAAEENLGQKKLISGSFISAYLIDTLASYTVRNAFNH